MTESRDKKSLGRGLSALLGEINTPEVEQDAEASIKVIAIDRIRPNPDQPRRTFSADALHDLTESIAEKGVLQPLIVRIDPTDPEYFQIVAGERRWRASQRAQLHELPVLVRNFDDTEALEVAIIENIQRSDLNAVEEAAGYRQLMEKFGHTQERLAQALGKSRSHIANSMRLLKLPQSVQDYVVGGQLSAGHARTLITAEAPEKLAEEIIKRGLSVRQAEMLGKKAAQEGVKTPRKPKGKDADTLSLEGDLSAQIGLKVSISHRSGGSGSLKIDYRSLEDLDQICQVLSGLEIER